MKTYLEKNINRNNCTEYLTTEDDSDLGIYTRINDLSIIIVQIKIYGYMFYSCAIIFTVLIYMTSCCKFVNVISFNTQCFVRLFTSAFVSYIYFHA